MVIKIKPLSVNQAWKGRKFKTDKYKSYILKLNRQLPNIKNDFKGRLKASFVFGFSSSASDIDNPLKPLIDILQKKYKFNDNQIFILNVEKQIVKKGEEFIEINIEKII